MTVICLLPIGVPAQSPEAKARKPFGEKEKAVNYAANRRKEGRKARVRLVSEKWRVYLK